MLAVIDLCVLGLGPGIPVRALRTVMRIVWTGMLLAAMSGVLLFIADGARYYYSFIFRFKLASILLGVWLACALSRRVSAGGGHAGGVMHVSMRSRMLAACSLLCWLSAIAAGRLVAYAS